MSTLIDLEGKAAVVTGAASGIGRGIARALASRGCRVALADVDLEGAQKVARDISESGVDAFALRCDVSRRTDVEALAQAAWGRFDEVNIVANNAGVAMRKADCIDTTEDESRRVLDINLMGVVHGCAIFGRRFVDQGTPAWIINTGSENSLGAPVLGMAMYTATKHAVLGYSDVLRQELPDSVGVSVLCPGIVATKMSSISKDDEKPEFGLTGDEVGEMAVAGMLAGEFYIVTHGPVAAFVDERYQEIMSAFARQAPRVNGDEYLDTRHAIKVVTERTRQGP